MVQQVIIFWKDEIIALKNIGNLLPTNFDHGHMKVLIKNYLVAYVVTTIKAISYGTRIDDDDK